MSKKKSTAKQDLNARIRYCPNCKADREVQNVMHMQGKTRFRNRCKTCDTYVD